MTSMVLALAMSMPAQCGYGTPCYNYHTPVHYQAPVQYQQPYYPQPYYQPPYYPAQKIYASEIGVAPLIVTVPTVPIESKAVPIQAYGQPYYWSVTNAYAEKAYIREVVREEFRNAMNGTIQPNQNGYGQPQPRPPVGGQPTQPVQGGQPTQPAQPAAPVADDFTPIDLQTKVIAAYNGRAGCLNCHGASGDARGVNGKPFRLVVETPQGMRLTKFDSTRRWQIYGMASSGAMPKVALNDASKGMETPNLPFLLQYALQPDPGDKRKK